MSTKPTRQLAVAALTHYPLDRPLVKFVSDTDNVIFKVRAKHTEYSEHRSDYVLRIYPKSDQSVYPLLPEINWLISLSQDTDLHIPKPIPGFNEEFVQDITLDNGGKRFCALFTWVEGRFYDRGLTSKRLKSVGEFIGALHNHARVFHQNNIDPCLSSLQFDLSLWTDSESWVFKTISKNYHQIINHTAARLRDEILVLRKDAYNYGFIHADIHHANFLFHKDKVGVIDFKDCGWGHYSYDLASTLLALKYPIFDNFDHRANYSRFKDALLDGYSQASNLSPNLEKELEIYRIARLINILGWIAYWPSPAYCSWGPSCVAAIAEIFGQAEL